MSDPDGVLFYGYTWPVEGEDQDFETDMDEAVKVLLARRGHTDPWDEHYNGDYEAWKAWAAENPETVDAYRAAQRALKHELGVDWDSGCSYEQPAPYLYVVGTKTCSEWGDAQAVRPADMTVGADWKQKLDAFLATQEITPPEGENQPGWWLTSFYG